MVIGQIVLLMCLGQPDSSGVVDYTFALDTDRWVAIERDELLLIGKMTREGEFQMVSRHKRGAPLSTAPAFEVITQFKKYPAPVYEYRSGRLIKGEMTEEGHFVPELGSKVIDFKDYKYSPDGIRIWNLPGKFVKKSK